VGNVLQLACLFPACVCVCEYGWRHNTAFPWCIGSVQFDPGHVMLPNNWHRAVLCCLLSAMHGAKHLITLSCSMHPKHVRQLGSVASCSILFTILLCCLCCTPGTRWPRTPSAPCCHTPVMPWTGGSAQTRWCQQAPSASPTRKGRAYRKGCSQDDTRLVAWQQSACAVTPLPWPTCIAMPHHS